MAENYITVENVSKSFGEKELFSSIGFGINKGQKIALVAENGSGKTTLLKIIANKEIADNGTVSFRKGITISYLEQHPLQAETSTIMDVLFNSSTPLMQTVKRYQQALLNSTKNADEVSEKELSEAILEMDCQNAWNYESQIKEILGKLNITDLTKNVSTLSGGEKKKVALCATLISKSEVLLLDEPTNHLDIEMIEWLEEYLNTANQSILFVSHDRYFIDKVSTDIYELDRGQICKYEGKFDYYLEKKAERQQQESVTLAKAKNLYKKELEWIRRMPQARGTKSRARIDAFNELKETISNVSVTQSAELTVKAQRIGGKILELNNINKSFGNRKIIDDFSHIYKKGDKIGIIGKNGCGKTTLLEIITEKIRQDSGKVTLGQTIKIGYYTQNPIEEKPDTKVIDIVKKISEHIQLADGTAMGASQYLTHFGIPPYKQHTHYGNLSGGEKRLLNLLCILISNPNFLILDEPTNDLDIYTQMKLETFLEQYQGCLMVVSHDRHFLDRIVSQLFVFKPEGKIKEFPGNYTDYLIKEKEENKQKKQETEKKENSFVLKKKDTKTKVKLTYKEQKEKETIEETLPILESRKEEIEQLLSSGELANESLLEKTQEYQLLLSEIEEKEFRWLELCEKEQ
ncbi:MAG: ABC-F family ATP-binding cassette domain-containing protein [Bacteroidales bacterium]|nr:ABC-F family ATP-binding cassette domain-containing protein [Bacteroidales bacterium]